MYEKQNMWQELLGQQQAKYEACEWAAAPNARTRNVDR
jgi:hypothetical protein